MVAEWFSIGYAAVRSRDDRTFGVHASYDVDSVFTLRTVATSPDGTEFFCDETPQCYP